MLIVVLHVPPFFLPTVQANIADTKNRIVVAPVTEAKAASPGRENAEAAETEGTGTEKDTVPPAPDMNVAIVTEVTEVIVSVVATALTVATVNVATDTAVTEATDPIVVTKTVNVEATVIDVAVVATETEAIAGIVIMTVTTETVGIVTTVAVEVVAETEDQAGMIDTATADMEDVQAKAGALLVTCRPCWMNIVYCPSISVSGS